MRETMTMIEHANTYNEISNRHRLAGDRTIRRQQQQQPSHSFDDRDEHLKVRSFDVYTSQYLIKPFASHFERTRLDELFLPPIEKSINRRKKKRPVVYRQSMYHSNMSTINQLFLPQVTARGAKQEIPTMIWRDDDTTFNFQRHHAPPPSPSDDQIERLLIELNEIPEHPHSPSPVNGDGYVPYRLPALDRLHRERHLQSNLSSINVKSTVSNYLRSFN